MKLNLFVWRHIHIKPFTPDGLYLPSDLFPPPIEIYVTRVLPTVELDDDYTAP